MRVLGSTKPVKLRGFGETNKYGVAARDLQELVKKGCNLLKVRLSLYLFIFHSGYMTSVREQQPAGLNPFEPTCCLAEAAERRSGLHVR